MKSELRDMKSILIDSDICIDVYLHRLPFVKESTKLLSAVEKKKPKGVVSAVAHANIFYILSKEVGKEKALKRLRMLRSFTFLGVINSDVFDEALHSGWPDFEDALQHFCAVEEGCEAIVTRNVDDYKKATLPVFTPAQFLEEQLSDSDRDL